MTTVMFAVKLYGFLLIEISKEELMNQSASVFKNLITFLTANGNSLWKCAIKQLMASICLLLVMATFRAMLINPKRKQDCPLLWCLSLSTRWNSILLKPSDKQFINYDTNQH